MSKVHKLGVLEVCSAPRVLETTKRSTVSHVRKIPKVTEVPTVIRTPKVSKVPLVPEVPKVPKVSQDASCA